ncbi:hypothetical protein ACOYR1_17265 [Thalassotalea piscium]
MTSMDSSTPFHKQIKGRIVSIAFLFSCLFIGILAILYTRETALFSLKRETLPAIETQLNSYKLLVSSEQLLSQILIAKHPQNFDSLFLQYQHNLQALIKAGGKNTRYARKLLAEIEPFQFSVKKLTANYEKNEQLKQSTIVQLQLVTTALHDALAKENSVHRYLYQQSIELLSQALIMMESLSISTDIETFILFTERLSSLNQQWMLFLKSDESNTIDAKVAVSIFELNNLLWVEQRSIAKWRGHIRISQEFLALIEQHYDMISSLSAEFNIAQLPSDNLWPKALLPYLPKEVKNSTEAYYIALASILALFLIWLWLLLFSLARRIKRYQRHSLNLVEQQVKGEVSLPIVSAEQQRTLDLIQQLAKPAHSEADYQQLKSKFAQQIKLLAQHSQTVVWSSNQMPEAGKLTLRHLLQLSDGQCWYHAFSREVVKQVLADARQVRSDGAQIFKVIKDKQGRSLSFTLEYIDLCWQGTLSTQEHKTKLEQELVLLNQQMQAAQQSVYYQQIEHSQKLSKMLIRTMLQSQSASLGLSVAPPKVYRHLIRMLEWSKQLHLTTLLGSKDRQVQLTDVNLSNELYALMTNIAVEANLQRNTISYSIDRHITAPCKFNVRLFHQTLSHFLQLLLQELLKGHLHLMVTMADKNSGQQILNFAFSVTHQESSAVLPDVITDLININEKQLDQASTTTQYFYRVFKATHCEQLQTNVVENGYEISFNMPITTSALSINRHEDIDFNQGRMLLLTRQSVVKNTLELFAKKHHVMLSTMGNTKDFTQQVNAKELTKRGIEVVIVAEDVYTRDFDLILQHVNALPKNVQPKLFVLQPFFNQAFYQKGMYQHTQNVLNAASFAEEVKQFIKSDDQTNLILAADLFKQYRFSSTQVEVLFAVAEPKQHEILQRLLHWMGLQIHLVSNQQAMLKQWQSGRYLILITEFEISPLIPLEVGRKVKRSVYTFKNTQIAQYRKEITDEYRHWDTVLLPNVLDVAALVNVFSPWLKDQHIALSPKRAPKLAQPSVIKKVAPLLSPIVAPSEEKIAFDLAKYAQNQGSSELAAFMLSDYISEIEANIAELVDVIAAKDRLKAEIILKSIIKVTKILAAKDLLDACQVLSQALSSDDFKGCNRAISDLQLTFKLLATYAEGI